MSIADREYKIKKFYTAVKNKMNKGFYTSTSKSAEGRHCDCFVLCTGGECLYKFDDRNSISVSAGDILYLAKGSRYCMKIKDNYEVKYSNFDFETERAFKSELIKNAAANTGNLFDRLIGCFVLKKKAYQTECVGILNEIYANIIRTKTAPYISEKSREIVDSALDIMAKNFTSPSFRTDSLPEKFGLSEGHFRRIFRSARSVSPKKYIIDMRIDYAKTLIAANEHSLNEIYPQCGFESRSYFDKTFKQHIGMTPASYRAMLKKI